MVNMGLHNVKSIEIKPQKLMRGNGSSWYSGAIVIKFIGKKETDQEIAFYSGHAHDGDDFPQPAIVSCTEEGIATAQEMDELKHRLAIGLEILNTDMEVKHGDDT